MTWISPMRSFLVLAFIASSFAGAADLPPTLVTPAAAAPVSVVGRTTQLTVTGTDDGGAAALTYTWTATGPASVTVAPNGTATAKTATATFTAPGTYTLTAKIADILNRLRAGFNHSTHARGWAVS